MKKKKQKMKLWKKISLIVVVLLIAIASYLLYLFQFKEYDTADSEVAEITRETYKLELPDGSTLELDEEGNIIEADTSTADASGNETTNVDSGDGTSTSDGTTSSTDSGASGNSSKETSSGSGNSTAGSSSDSGNGSSSNGNSTSGGTTGSGSSNGNNTESGVTVATIKGKYEPVMSNLQAQANGRIDALVGRALAEYQGKKASGESVNYAYFYNKYSSAASELEGRTDKVFYQLISVIEKELEANGYGKSHAQSLVSEYEAQKEARRNALLDKAMNR